MFYHRLGFIKYTVILLILLVLATFSIRNILFTGSVLEPSSLPESSIIDMHVHIAGLGYGGSGCFVADEMKNSYKFDYYLKAFGVTREEMKAEGDQVVIERVAQTLAKSEHVNGAIILAMDGVIDDNGELDKSTTQVYIPNDYVAEKTALYPSLYFGASINPYRRDALERLEKVKRQGAKLIKWIPNIQHIDPADKTLIPFYEKMKALELPLLSHTGQERSFHSAIDEYGDPERLALPLSIGVTVIAGHIATTGESDNQSNYQRILAMFDKYPTLYADISSLTQVNKLGYFNQALQEPRLKGRLIYGSDYPLVNMILVSPYYFPTNLTLKQMSDLSSVDNPWDRDVSLKQALGLPADVFAKSAMLLNIK
ncbi:MAG: metal-dependent hydrolase [Methylophaga sp.]|nr:MAG: metal-dependent hydrolase [Methylophaga sp.]